MMRSNKDGRDVVGAGRTLAVLLVLAGCGAATGAAALAEPPERAAKVEPKADAMPPVFSKVAFADAVKQTEGNAKVLVVKFTAEWCGPCKIMDRTTWRDETVVKWVTENGLAIQVDVDREPKISESNKVRAMPTMVAFKDGKEFDRVVGLKQSAELLEWLEAVKAGRKSSDAMVERLTKVRGEAPSNAVANRRMQLARELMSAGMHEEATTELAWLWENIPSKAPSLRGVRVSFLVDMIEQTAQEHAPARARFVALRDKLTEELRTDRRSFDMLGDWLALNKAVGDTDATLAWFDRIKDDAEAKGTITRFGRQLEEVLQQRERWADLGRIIRDPEAAVQAEHMNLKIVTGTKLKGLGEAELEGMAKFARERFLSQSGRLYGALLAADRVEEAGKLAAQVLKLEDTPAARLALVDAAVRVERASALQSAWLEEVSNAKERPANFAQVKAEFERATKK